MECVPISDKTIGKKVSESVGPFRTETRDVKVAAVAVAPLIIRSLL